MGGNWGGPGVPSQVCMMSLPGALAEQLGQLQAGLGSPALAMTTVDGFGVLLVWFGCPIPCREHGVGFQGDSREVWVPCPPP